MAFPTYSERAQIQAPMVLMPPAVEVGSKGLQGGRVLGLERVALWSSISLGFQMTTTLIKLGWKNHVGSVLSSSVSNG